MAQFKSFAPGVEVTGEAILALVEAMPYTKNFALEILAENGIPDPQPGRWYAQQSWLNAFKTIAETIGPFTLFEIGQQIPENAVFPPGIDTLEKALSSIDEAYHMNHRGGEIGHYHFIKTGDKSAKMTCDNPYPCDFDQGIIESFTMKFKPNGTLFIKIKHDDSQPCRKQGADSCTYLISW
jgi:hypothetical protein